jgi:hypothetical protein
MASIVTQTLQVLASSVQIVDVTIDENSFVYDMPLLSVIFVTVQESSFHTLCLGYSLATDWLLINGKGIGPVA